MIKLNEEIINGRALPNYSNEPAPILRWVGAINQALGIMLLLAWPFVHLLVMMNCGIGDDPISYVMSRNDAYANWALVSHVVALPMTILLVVSGRALERGKPKGTLLTMIYAIYGLAAGGIHLVVTYFWLYVPLAEGAVPPLLWQEGAGKSSIQPVLVVMGIRGLWMLYLVFVISLVGRKRRREAIRLPARN